MGQCLNQLIKTNDTFSIRQIISTDSFFLLGQITIDTIFLCFCEDCKENDGISKPYFMSRDLLVWILINKIIYWQLWISCTSFIQPYLNPFPDLPTEHKQNASQWKRRKKRKERGDGASKCVAMATILFFLQNRDSIVDGGSGWGDIWKSKTLNKTSFLNKSMKAIICFNFFLINTYVSHFNILLTKLKESNIVDIQVKWLTYLQCGWGIINLAQCPKTLKWRKLVKEDRIIRVKWISHSLIAETEVDLQ